jgi:hypothetical protein
MTTNQQVGCSSHPGRAPHILPYSCLIMSDLMNRVPSLQFPRIPLFSTINWQYIGHPMSLEYLRIAYRIMGDMIKSSGSRLATEKRESLARLTRIFFQGLPRGGRRERRR